MTDLVQRLEQATEGSRELDAAIRFAVFDDMVRCNYEEGSYCKDAGKPDHDNENGCGKWLGLHDERSSYPFHFEDDDRLPHYTTSLDAALTLYVRVPNMIPSNPIDTCIEGLRQRAEILG